MRLIVVNEYTNRPAIVESSELVPLTYKVSEWSLSSRSVRAWWELPRDGARSYLGRSPAEPEDQHPARCCHTGSGSPLSTSNRSHRRTPAGTACSWSRRWSDSRTTQNTAAGIPKREILWQFNNVLLHVNACTMLFST